MISVLRAQRKSTAIAQVFFFKKNKEQNCFFNALPCSFLETPY